MESHYGQVSPELMLAVFRLLPIEYIFSAVPFISYALVCLHVTFKSFSGWDVKTKENNAMNASASFKLAQAGVSEM